MKANSQQILIAGIELTFTRKRVRNINLRVQPSTGEVKLSAPYKAPMALIERFVISRAEWIAQAQEDAQKRKQVSEYKYKSGDRLPFLGEPIRLTIEQASAGFRYLPDSAELMIFISDVKASDEKVQASIKAQLDRFYRQELLKRMPDIFEKWQPIVGATAKEYRVRKMRTRWGSCNIHKARVWISLELIKYPLECLEYVVVHELTHLLEPSHNKRFILWLKRLCLSGKTIKNC